MALGDPVMAYTAGSNVEAHLVCGLLHDAGIEAVVVEDVSQAGVWVGGLNTDMHKPQVWVERADIDRVGPLVAEYERRSAERWVAERSVAGEPVAVVCEGCGRQSEFPAAQRGTVQNCPHCRAYVDVGDDIGFDGWDEVPGEEG